VRLLEVGIFDKTLGKQTKQKNIPGQFEEVQEGSLVTGFVRNITPDGVFVGPATNLDKTVGALDVEDQKIVQLLSDAELRQH
jgi:rRNA biogenesis protein RRP5